MDPLEELVSLGYTYDYEDFVFLIRDNDEALRDQNVADVTDSSTMIDRSIYTRNVDLQELFKINFVFIKEKEANFEAAVNVTRFPAITPLPCWKVKFCLNGTNGVN